ncbi:sodium-coupled monocarboxylate transporter 1-like [Lineus longissimus]|uniref:sodium-coupled monocarboxylate transporter 1-like n=1 Tax=Lineus longissimus TaxID=88925 RepID=UPI00315DDFB1
MAVKTFSVWDYVIFGLMLAVSAAIGIYFGCTGGKQRGTQEFFLANRNMQVLPVAMSLLASFMSAITLLGTPSEVYVYGTQYWLIGVSYFLVIPFSSYLLHPIFYRLRLTSVYEYLEMRFHRSLRVFGALTFILQMTLYMAIVLYAPSLALNQVTGLNIWISVFSVGLVCTFYTTLGGIKAVMWTDTFQICLMFAGLLAVLIQGSIQMGGFSNIWQKNYEGGRIEFFNFEVDPTVRHTWWSLVIGGFFTWTTIYGVNQAQVQRVLTLPTEKNLASALWINLPGLFGLLTLTAMCGMVIYAMYGDCDPKTMGDIMASDQLLPLFVMDNLSFIPGLPGLFMSCIFSGSLSTISSGLNSLAAVTLQDVVSVLCCKNLTDKRATLISKILAVVYGLVCIALTFVASQLGGVLQAALGLFGFIGGPTFGLFLLGMLFPCANWKGGFVGIICGLCITMWIGIGAQFHKPIIPTPAISIDGCNSTVLNATMYNEIMTSINATALLERTTDVYSISYMWYATIAVISTVSIGLLVSLITGCTKPGTVDPALISPIFDVCCCYLPKSWRRKLNCGVDHSKESALFKERNSHELEVKHDDGGKNVTTDMADVDYLKPNMDGNKNKTDDAANAERGELPPSYSTAIMENTSKQSDVVAVESDGTYL